MRVWIVVGVALLAAGGTAVVLSGRLMAIAPTPTHAEGSGRSAVAVLVDFSESFAPLKPADVGALRQVAETIEWLARGRLTKPITIAWLAIGSSSIHTAAPCGSAFEYEPRMVPGRKKPNQLATPEQLRARLTECIAVVERRSRQTEKNTDISGAIRSAISAAAGANGRHVIFILSDFVEDRRPGDPEVPYKFSKEEVVMLYRPEGREVGSEMYRRLEEWNRKLEGVGAKVCQREIKTVTAAGLKSCFSLEKDK